jgi:cleavage and polyadenylation specificity factor subunit 1
MVMKPDGTWRPCGDYRRLNMVTEADRYPLPNMLDFSSRLKGCKVFSKLDLRKGYHQIPMEEDDIPKTAIITPFGLYEFLRMPFGLRNASMTFQRVMDRITGDFAFVFCYQDDMIVASVNEEQHLLHLRAVLERLRQHGLVLNGEKCLFGQSSVEFLGHLVSAEGAAPMEKHVAAVRKFPQPTTVKELQGYLGLINFYRRFLPAVAKILVPLTDVLKGGRKGSEQLEWTEAMQAAFKQSKESLCQATTLAHPDSKAQLGLWVDASAAHIGAVAQQRLEPGGVWQPLGFYSRKLAAAEVKYSAFDRELLACRDGIRHFRHLLEGRVFTIFTDHKPLVHAIGRISDPWSARQCRHLAYVAEFTNDIQHVSGVDNVVADALSRPPAVANTIAAVPATGVPLERVIDWREMARAQGTCVQTLQATKSPSLQLLEQEVEGASLLGDISRGIWRPVVPACYRRVVFEACHNVAHPGTRATRRLLAARFVWPGMNADIGAWCRDCQACQRGKVTKQPAAPLQPIPIPGRRFSHIHLDLVGPLPASREGHTHILTIIDRTTRWLEAIPLQSTSARACADALVEGWIARFGVPAHITTDRGVQFTSEVWSLLCDTLGVTHSMTTSYHPQSNGMIERSHRQIKDSLRSRVAGQDWQQHLPWVLLGLRVAPKEDSGLSSAELVYGSTLTLPGDFPATPESPTSDFIQRVQRLQPPRTRLQQRPPQPAKLTGSLAEASHVYVRRGGAGPPLSPLYSGPYEVITRGPKTFTVLLGDRQEVISVDRLKPHLGAGKFSSAQPPTRGRPPVQSPPP